MTAPHRGPTPAAPVGFAPPPAPTLTERGGELDRALARVGDAPLREGNALTLLRDGPATYADWLAAIDRAGRWVHLENYIFKAAGIGRVFAEALMARAAAGVRVRVLYDWWGSSDVPGAFYDELRRAGVDVRVVTPPGLADPFRIVNRDHSKLLAVDGDYAALGGVGIDDQWLKRSPDTGLPYRDMAVRVAGPAVADLERHFAVVWDANGAPLPADERPAPPAPAGGVAARVVSQEPGRGRMQRTLQLVLAAARERVWIADAYFLGVPLLREALMAAARDGVDVRVLLPGHNDLRVVGALSRAGYRPLLEAGVRIFEYAGLMMHAKTAVADGWWGRVGSTNLNPTGIVGNWELDLIAEDRPFAAVLEASYADDLAHAREIRLTPAPGGSRVAPERPETAAERRARRARPGKRERAGATAARAGGAALAAAGAAARGVVGGEQLTRHERRVGGAVGGALLGGALLGARYPRLVAWPLAAVAGAAGALGLSRSLRRAAGAPAPATPGETPGGRA